MRSVTQKFANYIYLTFTGMAINDQVSLFCVLISCFVFDVDLTYCFLINIIQVSFTCLEMAEERSVFENNFHIEQS